MKPTTTIIEIAPGVVVHRHDTETRTVFTDPDTGKTLAKFRPWQLYEGFKIQNFVYGMREGARLALKKKGDEQGGE